MPETITKEFTVYKFDELSDRAKERALEDWARNFDFDASGVIDSFKDNGKERGFDIDDVRYSISYSQGDGASWQGRVKLGPFLDCYLKDDNPNHARYIVLRELIRDGWLEDVVEVGYTGFRYVHSNMMRVDDISQGALWGEVEIQDGEDALITCDSVLKGASVRELAESIDYSHLLDDLHLWVETEARAYADDIYKALLADYEYETGYEYFEEMADANEWRFDETGNFV